MFKNSNKILFLITGDSIAASQQQYRREISGFVNNHRPVPSASSNTPPRRSSTTDQQQVSVVQRPSLTKQNSIINKDNVDSTISTKR